MTAGCIHSAAPVFAALSLALLLAGPAHAATYYWDTNGATAGFGTAGGTWGTNAFWSTNSLGTTTPSVTVTAVDALHFGTATTGLAGGTINVSGTQAAQSLTFGAASGVVTLSGGTINLNTGSINGQLNVNQSAIINSDITKTGAGYWNGIVAAGKTLTLNGNLNNTAAANEMYFQGDGAVVINGSIGSGFTNFRLNSGGTNVTLNGSNSFTGFLLVESGTAATVTLAGPNTFGGRIQLVNAAHTLNFSAVNQLGTGTGTNYIAIQNGSTLNYTGAGSETISGRQIYWNSGAATVNVANSNANLIFDLSTAGATRNQTFTKTGAGTLTFTGSQATTGPVNVDGGTLKLDTYTAYANSATTIAAGATLELTSTNTTVDNWRINTALAGSGTINKTGTGWIQTFTNANTFSGTVNIKEGTFGASGLNSNWTGVTADFNISSGALLDGRGQAITIGSLNDGVGAGTVGNTWSSATTLNVGAGNKSGSFSGSIQGNASTAVNNPANPNAGVLNLVKIGSGTQTLSGVHTYTGTTTVNGGTLSLNYSSQNNSKLADGAALILGGGTLNLAGGSHTEIVSATTLTAGTASNITRSSGSSILRLNAITRGAGASLNLSAAGIAQTDTLNNSSGILGSWATIGGTDWAMNSTNGADGLITAYSGYTDVTRLSSGTKAIPNSSTANVRIVEGTGSAGDITLAAGTTTINTLNQSASGGASAATVDLAGQTLGTSAILLGSGAGGLTIGTAVNNGTLRAATSGGDLVLNNQSNSTLTVNSVIANNTSASTLTKAGAGLVTLTGNNTYTGATYIGGGTLQLGDGTSGHDGTIAGASIVNNGALVYNLAGTPAAYSGVISGTGSVTKTGAGTQVLSGNNTYTGGTTVDAGILRLDLTWLSGGNTTIKNYTINSGTTLELFNTTATTDGQRLQSFNPSGTGTILKTGAGYLDLTWSVSGGTLANFDGAIVVDAGTLGINAGTQGSGKASLTVNSGASFDIRTGGLVVDALSGSGTIFASAGGNALSVGNNNGGATFSGVIQNGIALTKNGTGTQTLTGVNTFTGGVTINDGTLKIGGAGQLGSGAYTAAIVNSGTLQYSSSADQSFANLTGTGNLIKDANSSVLTLSTGNILYTGATTVSDGTLRLANTAANYRSETTVGNGATLELAGTGNADRNSWTGNAVTLNNGATLSKTNTGYDTINFGNIVINGAVAINISNSGVGNQLYLGNTGTGLTGSGTINLTNTGSSSTGLILRSGVHATNFNGVMNVNGGAVTIQSGASLALDNTHLNLTGANFNLSAAASVRSLSGDSTSNVALGGQTLTLGTNNGTGGNFAGAISGAGGIILKTGSGTQTLSGTNTFTGGIRSTGGVLNLNGVQNNAVDFRPSSGSPTININGTQTVGLFYLSDNTLPGGALNSTTTVNVNNGGTLNITNAGLLGVNGNGATGILNIKNGGVVNVTTTDFRLGNAQGVTSVGVLTMDAGSTLNFNTAGTVIRVANGNLTTGTINLNGGTMTVNGQIRGDAPIAASAGTNAVNFNGGTLKAGVSITTFLQGMDAANVRNRGAIFDTNNFNITIAQALQHSAIGGDAAIDGGLTKLGDGTLTLTGNSTYTGMTTVRGGTLALSHASNNNLANSHTIRVDSGAILDVTGLAGVSASDLILASGQRLQGTGTIVGNVTVGGASILAPGNSPGQITFHNNLTLQSGATVEFEGGDLIVVNGLLTMPSSWVLDLTGSTNWAYNPNYFTVLFDYNTASLAGGWDAWSNILFPALPFDTSQVTLFNDTNNGQILLMGMYAVPEPSTCVLLAGVALIGLGGCRRRLRGGLRRREAASNCKRGAA